MSTEQKSNPFERHNPVKAQLMAQYGENQPVSGTYDATLAAKCSNGTFVGKQDGDAVAFRGIPFAQPPVGALRWKKPVPVKDCDGVFEAYFNGKSQIQTEWPTERASYYPQSEDCLYLNVWKNRKPQDGPRPVMVFLHGGAYGWGGTADPLYDGRNFVTAEPDIVLITVAYRIGIMGFIDFSEVPGGEEYPDAPNLGIYDIIEALRWVQKNAEAFGGDPNNVTIFGESAGGGCVSILPFVEQAKGLFRRVIAESGSVALTFSKKETLDFTRRLLQDHKELRTMKDLLALSEEQIRAYNEPINEYNNFPQRDGVLIPLDPYEPYRKGVTKDIDIIVGTNANEMNYWIGEVGGIVAYRFGIPVKFENDLKQFSSKDQDRAKVFIKLLKGHEITRISEFYNEIMFRLPAIEQAEHHAKNGGKVYLYYWTEPSTIRHYHACHAVELAYVFGNTEDAIYTGTPADRELSRRVMHLWASFAKTGTPDAGDMTWEPYDAKKRATMVLSKKLRMRNDILPEQREMLKPLLKYQLNGTYKSLDLHVPFVRKAAIKITILAILLVAIILGIIRLFL